MERSLPKPCSYPEKLVIPLLTAAFIGVVGFLFYTVCDFIFLMSKTKDRNAALNQEMRELEEELRNLRKQCEDLLASIDNEGKNI